MFEYQKRYDDACGVFLSAAKQNNVTAQLELGKCFYEGKGIKQDYDKAHHWWSLAAEQDNNAAQCKLAMLFSNGIGMTPCNHHKTYT